MDPMNCILLQWKKENQSFFGQLKLWNNLLDPTSLLASDEEVKKAHAKLGSSEKLDEEDRSAVILSMSSVQVDSGEVIPMYYRSPAFFPVMAPLLYTSLLPHRSVKFALCWQLFLQSYNAGFTHANRNCSAKKLKELRAPQFLLNAGAISFTTVAGIIPHIAINRLDITSPPIQNFLRTIVPIPLSTALAFLSVYTVRGLEPDTGIQVYDHEGKPVGLSKAAGKKAVMETSLSRAAFIGTSTAVPNLVVFFLQKTMNLKRNSFAVRYCHLCSALLAICLMVPVSFSLYPKLGTIKRENLEEELQAGALGETFFYHRGL